MWFKKFKNSLTHFCFKYFFFLEIFKKKSIAILMLKKLTDLSRSLVLKLQFDVCFKFVSNHTFLIKKIISNFQQVKHWKVLYLAENI